MRRMKEAIVTAALAAIGVVALPFFASAQTMCTMQYDPVCGAQPVQCITTPCYPQYQTYGNACMAGAAGAAIIHRGECLPHETGPVIPHTPAPYTPPATCKAWFDGCNSCSRTDAGVACTKKYCSPETTQAGYCIAYDKPKPPAATTTPPVYKPPFYYPPVYQPLVYYPPQPVMWWHWFVPWHWGWWW